MIVVLIYSDIAVSERLKEFFDVFGAVDEVVTNTVNASIGQKSCRASRGRESRCGGEGRSRQDRRSGEGPGRQDRRGEGRCGEGRSRQDRRTGEGKSRQDRGRETRERKG